MRHKALRNVRGHLTCNEREQVEGSPNVHARPVPACPKEAALCIPGKIDHTLSHFICATLPHHSILILTNYPGDFRQGLLLKIKVSIQVRRLNGHSFIP